MAKERTKLLLTSHLESFLFLSLLLQLTINQSFFPAQKQRTCMDLGKKEEGKAWWLHISALCVSGWFEGSIGHEGPVLMHSWAPIATS